LKTLVINIEKYYINSERIIKKETTKVVNFIIVTTSGESTI